MAILHRMPQHQHEIFCLYREDEKKKRSQHYRQKNQSPLGHHRLLYGLLPHEPMIITISNSMKQHQVHHHQPSTTSSSTSACVPACHHLYVQRVGANPLCPILSVVALGVYPGVVEGVHHLAIYSLSQPEKHGQRSTIPFNRYGRWCSWWMTNFLNVFSSLSHGVFNSCVYLLSHVYSVVVFWSSLVFCPHSINSLSVSAASPLSNSAFCSRAKRPPVIPPAERCTNSVELLDGDRRTTSGYPECSL